MRQHVTAARRGETGESVARGDMHSEAPIMLETLDPMSRVPVASGEPAREASAIGPDARRAGRSNHVSVMADRGGNGSDVPAEDNVAGGSWSSDWLRLSHELRTPLNAMLGNIELLLDGSAGPLAAPVRACIGDLQAASRQLLRQLQPLLLLVQARTAGAVASGPPIDLLTLLRQAAADPGPASYRQGEHGAGTAARRASPRLPDDTSLMMAGDPVWLGALVAALIDLHHASPHAQEPLSILVEEPEEQGLGEPGADGQERDGGSGLVVRAHWPDFEPAAVSPLPLALIDAVLVLHGGRICSLGADGLRLHLPNASVVRRSISGRVHR